MHSEELFMIIVLLQLKWLQPKTSLFENISPLSLFYFTQSQKFDDSSAVKTIGIDFVSKFLYFLYTWLNYCHE